MSKTLIITGMHRSGTSLISHYLSQCGFYIGNDLINPSLSPVVASAGHHEDKDFLDFHNRILQKKRINVFLNNSNKLPIQISNSEKNKAKRLISSRSAHSQWAWKDPRTTLFLGFWNELIANPKYLFLFRNPLSVVDSLLRRGRDKQITDAPIIGLRAWKVYNQQILSFMENHKHKALLYDIDDLVRDFSLLPVSLEKQLSFNVDEVPFSKVFSTKAFVSASSNCNTLESEFPGEVLESMFMYNRLRDMSSD